MPEYRRIMIKGGMYFLTLVTYQRKRIFSSSIACSILKEAISHTQDFHPFSLKAYCYLPDHIHFLWQLPEDDSDYSTRISLIKRYFSARYVEKFGLPTSRNASRMKRREVSIWQRRFWEHYIRDEEDLNRHIDYIHFNPVKHGLVDMVRDWKYSSFFDYVYQDVYDLDWGEKFKFDDQNYQFGE